MRKLMIAAGLLAAGLAAGCAGMGEAAGFRSISPEKAKQMMAAPGAVVVDVREPGEYAEGHVPGAVLLPLGTIDAEHAAAVIPEKDSMVLVYCRSGVRSKKGAEKLADLGYTEVFEFGGIIQWPYETVR